MIQYILWDFNGTLVDDVSACLQNMNNLLKKYRKPLIDLTTYRDVFTFPVIEYYKRVGIIDTNEAFATVAHEWMAGYYAMEKDLKVFDDTLDNLKRVRHMGLSQGVLSASSTAQLKRLLDRFELTPYMDHILGLEDIYAKGKVEIGLDFIQNHQLSPNQMVLIGDTLHDYQVASQMGIHCILFSGGHQSDEILGQAGCRVVKRITDIFDQQLIAQIT